MNTHQIKIICARWTNLCPGVAPVWLRLHRVNPRPGGNDRIPADYSVRNIAGANIILAEVVKVGPEGAVHHRAEIRRRVIAVVEFLDCDDVRLQSLKNPKRERLVTLRIAIEVG